MTDYLNTVMQESYAAYLAFRHTSGEARKQLLYAIAEELEGLGDELLLTASAETHLPLARFTGERARTCMQLRAFGDLIAEGSWVEAVIDTAQPDRKPLPKPDMRKMLIPIGPVVVFGASNFPLAYATPGGDTASALAAGNTVVVKAHPAHPQTSKLCADAIQRAVTRCGLPDAVFQHVEDGDFKTGKYLTCHPHTAAVGFTGSQHGGRAIFDYAMSREVPIPVFAEMGSTNPVILMKEALKHRAPELARQLASSVTMGVGQFCTNPGILLGVKSSALNHFTHLLALELSMVPAYKMLHPGIHASYIEHTSQALTALGVETVYHAGSKEALEGSPVLARVDAEHFINNPLLHKEVFGPFSLIVVCKDYGQLTQAWKLLQGQLTTTFMADEQDRELVREMLSDATLIAGRVVFNGAPTGVEVGNATVHGGPYPATTDNRFTSVGMDAIRRWARPVCLQDCPQDLLPPALRDANPLGILRKLNGIFSRDAVNQCVV
jgi:alpha-ketoglutaric semialdehyde dehydrogenase